MREQKELIVVKKTVLNQRNQIIANVDKLGK